MMKAGTLLAGAALLLASCAGTQVRRQACFLAQGESVDLRLTEGTSHAIVAVESGRVDAVFRCPRASLTHRISAGERRGTCNRDGITLVTVTALQPAIFTVRTD